MDADHGRVRNKDPVGADASGNQRIDSDGVAANGLYWAMASQVALIMQFVDWILRLA